MKRARVVVLVIAIFISLGNLPPVHAQQGLPAIATDKQVYPIWNKGGNVNVTLSGLSTNSTYFLWLQRPSDPASYVIPADIRGGNSPQVFQLIISSNDTAGTYLLSLSSSKQVDTRIVVAHFGVFGIDKNSYQRTERIIVSGGGFKPNSSISVSVNATTFDVNASRRGDFSYPYAIPADAQIGQLIVTASGVSFDSGTRVSVSANAEDTPASIKFLGEMPSTVQRTLSVLFNFTLAYPNGTLLIPKQLISPPNITIKLPSATQTFMLNYSLDTGYWSHSYYIPMNATEGTYLYSLTAVDLFGNTGIAKGSLDVGLAKFIIAVPQPPSKVHSGQMIDIAIYVRYPNATSLTDAHGNVTAFYKDTQGNNMTVPMFFNSTDRAWHLMFVAPDQGFTFGLTLTFSFNAVDTFGNTGAATDVYVLTIGASTLSVILAGVAGAIIPIALLIWAMLTISKKRREHKP